MAETILKNVKLYYAGYDLSGDMNSLTLGHTVEMLDRTVFGSSFRRRRGGLRDMEISGGGFWNSTAGGNNPILYDSVGSAASTAKTITVLPEGTGIGNEAYFAPNIAGSYSPSGTIGGMLGFTFAGQGNGDFVMGKVLRAGWGSTLAAAAAIRKIGAGSTAKEKTACAVHVFKSSGAAGASVTLHVDRSTTTDFSSAATTAFKITLTTANVGMSGYYSTKLGSSAVFSYRINTSQAGTSLKRLNFVASVGHTKKL